jgi:hypothetical protein
MFAREAIRVLHQGVCKGKLRPGKQQYRGRY